MNEEILVQNGIEIEKLGSEWGDEYAGLFRFLHVRDGKLIDFGEMHFSVEEAEAEAQRYLQEFVL